MKKYLLTLFIATTSSSVLADCGELPVQPQLLQIQQINIQQLKSLDEELDSYMQEIQSYQDCVDSFVAALDIEAEDYQTKLEDFSNLYDVAEQQKTIAMDLFNTHVNTVDIEDGSNVTDQSPVVE